jgi:hypothetical protein
VNNTNSTAFNRAGAGASASGYGGGGGGGGGPVFSNINGAIGNSDYGGVGATGVVLVYVR